MLKDGLGRAISYLRLSVTDRCNLACTYCAGDDRKFIPHSDILRYEECSQLIALACDLGVEKVRFTGGEPFVRKGFSDFVISTLADFPGLDLRITTNATLLGPNITTLADAGLARINISLDTLDPVKYQRITGHDSYTTVRTAIEDCLAAGIRVKINAVAIKGTNDTELPAFLTLARDLGIDLRFIEHMPVGGGNGWQESSLWSAEEIVSEAGKIMEINEVDRANRTSGPARMFDLEGGGRLGVISPVSCHFCDKCNRLRVTSHGQLRTCLFSDETYDLRTLLRDPAQGIDAVREVIVSAIRTKPEGHKLLESKMDKQIRGASVCATRMHSIGG